MRTPKFYVACDDCWEHNPEAGCHYPESIAWSNKRQKWLCDECWGEDQEYDAVRDEYINEVPFAFAKDALLDQDEQMRRLVAAATKKRMGVPLTAASSFDN